MLLQETRVQPFPQYLVVHGDVRPEPLVADLIKAGFDVPLENPLRTVAMAPQAMGLCQGVRTAAFSPKAIGMAVGQGFRDGIETEQVESLHGSISHGGNSQTASLAIAF